MKMKLIKNDPRKPYLFWCPGCDRQHIIFTMGQEPHEVIFKDEVPTVKGVIRSFESNGTDGNGSAVIEVCEVYIENGLLRYTAACTHRFAKTHINMVDIDQKDFFYDHECL